MTRAKEATTSPGSVEDVILYTSYIIGEKDQKEAYVNYTININDTQVQESLKRVNQLFFKARLSEQLNVAVT